MGDNDKNKNSDDKAESSQNYPPPQRQQVYYQNHSYQNQTPVYQRQVGGQNVYVVGGPQEPTNVSRGRNPYRVNQPNQYNEDDYYLNEMDIFTDSFNSVKIRNRFVQRVYTILSIQLFFTFAVLLLITFEPNTKEAFQRNALIFLIIGAVLYFASAIALTCCSNLRRSSPLNVILLGVLTLGMTLLLSGVVAFSPPIIVIAAVGTTGLVCTVVSLFAIQTKWDVTTCGMCLCIATIVIMIYGLILMILMLCGIYLKILHIIYSALACLLFVFWLMYDTQMIVGGRRIELSPEEYVFGALTLYVDIMIIFMHILALYQHCMGDG